VTHVNGQLPMAFLRPIAGGSLSRDAAASWNLMNCEARKAGVELRPLGPASSYRPLDIQVRFWDAFQHGGNVAARPGTSNHGWGRAVDLADPPSMRPVFDRIAHKYGWSHAEGARVGESWHVTFVGGFTCPDPGADGSAAPPPRVTRRNAAKHPDEVRRLQRFLMRAGFLPPDWKVTADYGDTVRSAVWQFRARAAMKPCSDVDAACWEKLRCDPYAGLTDAERKMVCEYDFLTRTKGDADRRRALVELMTTKRKEIWRAASSDPRGWKPNQRTVRFEILKARTQEATP
jgi:hypothetical protein